MNETAAEVTQLFPELPSPGLRQIEITATLDGRDAPSMQIVVPEMDAEGAIGMALDACLEGPAFELKIRPLGPAAA